MKTTPSVFSVLLLAVTLACAPPDRDRTAPDATGRLSVAASLQIGDAADVDGFSRALEPRALVFPEDHGPHPDFRTEWWYWIGNLKSRDGRRFGYQLTFFRSSLAPPPAGDDSPRRSQALAQAPTQAQPQAEELPEVSGWTTRQVYMAHLALADVDGGRFRSHERFSRGAAGLAGARAEPFEVWLEDWSVTEGESGDSRTLRAAEGPIGLELSLAPGKPRVLHGNQGLSRKGDEPGAASYYYSRTRMPTRGRILIEGEALEVEGTSWFDREWSTSLLGRNEVGWDWLGAQLDDGRELMVFRLRRQDGSSARVDGTLVAVDGTSRALDTEGFELIPDGSWTSPDSGVSYPAAFRLELPAEELFLDIEPLLSDQELRLSFVYWEGAVAISGSTGGRGYLEMTGYGERASPR